MEFPRTTIFGDSNTVRQVQYDRETKRMRVFFVRNDAVWDYYDIAPTEYAALVAATSPGAVFNERIRNRYRAAQITFHEEAGRVVEATKGPRGQIVLLDHYGQF